MPELPNLPADSFSSWLGRIRDAQVNDNGIDVPCGDCNACCRSSYFIHIRPEETRTLSKIPVELLFPAPGLPKGNVLMGYDEYGRCPMLIDEKCSVYEFRPLTCRNYDCRVFTATGLVAGEAEKININQRIAQWKFSYPTNQDRNRHSAVKAAAQFLQDRAGSFPDGILPNNTSHLAILAIKVYDVFLKYIDGSGYTGEVPSDDRIVKEVMEAMDKFASGGDSK